MPRLAVGGLTPLSTTDYPGQLAAVVFCQGCPWHCRYCHNPHLIPRDGEQVLTWREVTAFLRRRRGLLDAVVFSGGEPTLQSGLAEACREVHELGFKVGLHTAGPYPERLTELLPLLDWVGMDIKAPLGKYERITGVPESGERVRESLLRLLGSGVAYEVRTTVHAALLDTAELASLARELAGQGVRHYVVQQFRPQGCGDAALCRSEDAGAGPAVPEEVQALFPHFLLRSS